MLHTGGGVLSDSWQTRAAPAHSLTHSLTRRLLFFFFFRLPRCCLSCILLVIATAVILLARTNTVLFLGRARPAHLAAVLTLFAIPSNACASARRWLTYSQGDGHSSLCPAQAGDVIEICAVNATAPPFLFFFPFCAVAYLEASDRDSNDNTPDTQPENQEKKNV
ncbi:hypothetical protein GGI43DRAFT_178643 [Trichoderma evansii]